MDPAVVYIIIVAALTLFCLFLAAMCFKKRKVQPVLLGVVMLFGAFAQGGYLMSILAQRKVLAAIGAGAYFASVDILLWFLLLFVYKYTDEHPNKVVHAVLVLAGIYTVFDTTVLLLNPLNYFVIDFENSGALIGGYRYVMHPVYYMHLLFSYLLVALILFNIIAAIAKTPRTFAGPTIICLSALILAVIFNFLYLVFVSGNSAYSILDYSIIMYGVTGMIFYLACFIYPDAGMRRQLQGWVTENISQGIALFDYHGKLKLMNDTLKQQFPDKTFEMNMPEADFMKLIEVKVPEKNIKREYSQVCFSKHHEGQVALTCAYKGIVDKKGMIIGSIFSFAEKNVMNDPVTGFLNINYFDEACENIAQLRNTMVYAAVCDVNNLSEINTKFGRATGDKAVSLLAETMHMFFPENTIFVRDREAGLVAVCTCLDGEDVNTRLKDTLDSFSLSSGRPGFPPKLSAQYGYASFDSSAEPVQAGMIRTILSARTSMLERKILDPNAYSSHQVNVLMMSLKQTDSDTEAHVNRTRRLGAALGEKIGLTNEEQSRLSILCLLHDIGKLGVPLEILNKPGKLTQEEWNVLKTHTVKGYQIALASAELSSIADMVLSHHERWDGKGYPNGLKEDEIPLLSRIISLVDSYDAMRSKRSYKPSMSYEHAVNEIRRCAGTQFDPNLAKVFLDLLDENPEIVSYPSAGDEPADEAETGAVRSAAEKKNTISENSEKYKIDDIKYAKYIVSCDNVIVRTEGCFEELTGYTKEDIAGNKVRQSDLIPDSIIEEYYAAVKRQQAGGEVAYIHHPIIRKDGSVIYVRCFGKPVFNSASGTMQFEIVITQG